MNVHGILYNQIRMTKAKGKIRIKDIAEKAGVSIGTVDRVLHNRGEVKEATRKKILEIVNEIGYTPNLMAKSLAMKKTFRFAVVVPEGGSNNPYWEKPLKGIADGATEIGVYNSEVDIYKFSTTNEKSFRDIVKKVIEDKPSGVIFNPVFKTASLDFIEVMDSLQIPYVFIDIDLEKGNNIAYYGQNSRQSGKVAAKLMSKAIPDNSAILIVKLSNHKVITSHIEKRIEGFLDFFKGDKKCGQNFISVEIDLLEKNELEHTLKKVFEENANIKGVFVPNSKVYKVARFLKDGQNSSLLLGFDLIQQNTAFLKEGIIDILISQKPEEQGYKSVMALFNYIVTRKEIQKQNYSPIDIIIKENIDYYN